MIAAGALLMAAPSAASPGIGDPVTDASFTTAYGQKLSLADLRGEVVVLTYWMTDCEVCKKQLDILDYYYRQRKNVGLRVLAITPEDLSVRELQYAFRNRAIHPVASLRGDLGPKEGLPTTYIIDRNGQLRYAASGGLEIEKLNEILVPLLKQPQP
jgi:peroxiredoxin